MQSEREIRNLYVNGRTICIEVFFCFLKFFSVRRTRSRHRMGTILGAWGESLNKHFGRCNPAKIAKHVYVCIACQSVISQLLNFFSSPIFQRVHLKLLTEYFGKLPLFCISNL